MTCCYWPGLNHSTKTVAPHIAKLKKVVQLKMRDKMVLKKTLNLTLRFTDIPSRNLHLLLETCLLVWRQITVLYLKSLSNTQSYLKNTHVYLYLKFLTHNSPLPFFRGIHLAKTHAHAGHSHGEMNLAIVLVTICLVFIICHLLRIFLAINVSLNFFKGNCWKNIK